MQDSPAVKIYTVPAKSGIMIAISPGMTAVFWPDAGADEARRYDELARAFAG